MKKVTVKLFHFMLILYIFILCCIGQGWCSEKNIDIALGNSVDAREVNLEESLPQSDVHIETRGKLLIVSAFSAAFSIGLAAFGAALGQGNALARALEAIGRNPESQSKIFPTLVLGLAFIESLALYALLIALALVFFNPLISKL